MPIRLALFEPDIPQNAGTIVRTAACLGVAVDLIEPAGFLLGDRQFRRAGLDYLALAALRRFPSWRAYQAERDPGRLVLLTTRGDEPYVSFRFRADDVLLLGRESAGVPDAVHAADDARLRCRCCRAPARLTSRSRRRWCWARHCGRRVASPPGIRGDEANTSRRKP